eukprot:CAMPEP_0115464196 /NCGR_PEP_ID=MMETSP0271-20121206/48749_1 /TAXON_ID=71861 /ORGANISM="Scrippsiella trochoidea, Strain CCMP3099" /LENGTH=99 /DNA_ID=CAMNT_0002891075 /DNA_START=105 /DNA_END=401 /DNA_ORIENTATION=+
MTKPLEAQAAATVGAELERGMRSASVAEATVSTEACLWRDLRSIANVLLGGTASLLLHGCRSAGGLREFLRQATPRLGGASPPVGPVADLKGFAYVSVL